MPMSRRRQMATMVALLTMTTVLFGALGCQNKTSDRDLTWVEPEDASRALLRRSGFGLRSSAEPMWLDPRTPEAFAAGHIPGAVNIPFRELESVYPTIRDRGTIIVYGASFEDTLAAAASKRLIELRHSNVLTLRGGLQAWERAGNPVERGVASASGGRAVGSAN